MKVGLLMIAMNLAGVLMVIKCQEGVVIQPTCRGQCGNVTIPYPFGIGEGCALDETFLIYCNETDVHDPRPRLGQVHGLDIIDISLDGHLRKYTYVAKDCYDNQTSNDATSTLAKFYYSSTLNKFTAVGCDTYSRLSGSSSSNQKSSSNNMYSSGCLSICYNVSSVVNGSCSGIGCCQTSVPKELSKFNVTLESYFKHRFVMDFNPCSFAFIADNNFFNFSISNLLHMPLTVPTVLDWAVGNQTCLDAQKNQTSYACSALHSECRDSDNGPGYLCFCSPGYQGNPYLPAGCLDVDECKDSRLNDCTHKCHNIKGNYTCSCPKWYRGDGKKNGQRCTLDQNKIIHFVIGGLVLFILLLAGSLVIYTYISKRKQRRLKEKFFKQNGGSILQGRITRGEMGSMNTMKVFTSEELKKATDDFSEDKICGRGGFGTVYKGHLSDGRIVAIKMSKIVDRSQIEQFINEITVLSQINHRNVVRFLGCCFETQVPLLVYEFIQNGTLSDHIHNNNQRPRMPWSTRLKIATETAGVLAYLHSAHSTPIIHRDIKPTNILLDEDFTSKVSDFGASRLVPKDENETCTMVQGTLGYLDPEYLQTGQLNEKSDVYSFGVVLIELLTGLNAVSLERSEQERSLAYYFLSLIKEDSLLEILEKGMVKEENIDEVMEVAKIAKMCLRVKGEERPTMKEVAMELEGLLMELKHKWAKIESNVEETEFLLSKGSENGDSIQMAEYSGNGNDFLLQIDDGR